jgi:tRNA-Thr(GGU) m(6)t(6)A37 methyltransferase TsaA
MGEASVGRDWSGCAPPYAHELVSHPPSEVLPPAPRYCVSPASRCTRKSTVTEPDAYLIRPIGVVRSALSALAEAPRQGSEGAPDAWLEIDPEFAAAVDGIGEGDEILVVTWLHRADRSVLMTYPRGDVWRPLAGVFATRSPDRPNPIGLHRVAVLGIEESRRVHVRPLEAIDGTPIVDLKPVLEEGRGG